MKLELYIRLHNNDYTRSILAELEIYEIRGISQMNYGTSTFDACKIAIDRLNEQKKLDMICDELSAQVTHAFFIKDKQKMSNTVAELLKF
ncbi:hypothetical protein BpHYR1_005745 [Brachionus plicatilis]|uniref:Uncharacterized protein n=1 Tax=Brachionus plicatilis TaxID=10195 RepID=A0A3M7S266_BRAPC|nr:hypothetical protein BpHYR1_005745 [Brachionus plicatilis]